mmetsp:Transcript_27503/g.40878  ORF Transcript_27503/g.40878 Transcript_27503/m.40878 type:complete len:89 (+) Transcript_27503:1319-1585(+)
MMVYKRIIRPIMSHKQIRKFIQKIIGWHLALTSFLLLARVKLADAVRYPLMWKCKSVKQFCVALLVILNKDEDWTNDPDTGLTKRTEC